MSRLRRASSSENDVVELKAMFDMFDRNKNGVLHESDLKNVFNALGFYVQPQELQEIVSGFGETKEISFEDFVRLTKDKTRSEFIDSDELHSAFSLFDKDGNGFIEKDELWELLKIMVEHPTIEDVERLMEEADTNKDGRIDYKEFVNQIVIKHSQKP